jgi:hypothetical protein
MAVAPARSANTQEPSLARRLSDYFGMSGQAELLIALFLLGLLVFSKISRNIFM